MNVTRKSEYGNKKIRTREIKSILKSAVAATLAMSGYMRFIGWMENKQFKIIKILGTLLTGRKNKEQNVSDSVKGTAAGLMLHLSMGIFFTSGYFFLWRNQIVNPGIKSGLMLGLANGLIGIAGWKLLFMISPHHPRIDLRNYLVHIFMAHGVFGVVASEIYSNAKKYTS